MLAGLFGKKSDHPLATLKSAQEVLNDVPKADALKALQEITSWLESLKDNGGEFKLEHRIAVLRLLDEAAQPHVRKLMRDYFGMQPLSKFQENRTWAALNEYFSFCEQLYAAMVSECRAGNRQAQALRPQFALLALRTIEAAKNRLKFAATRYALVDPAIWSHLAEVYGFAEQQDFQDEVATIYTGAGVGTTVSRELAATLVWHSVGVGALLPLHIHLAERLIASLNKSLIISKQLMPGCQWAFNLVQPSPPVRINADVTQHASVRFLAMGEAEQGLNHWLKSFEKSVTPQEINLLGVSYEVEVLQSVARTLVTRCVLPAPTRRNVRRKIKVDLHVANGFSKLLENTDVGLNFSSGEREVWEVEDISATGFRSVTSPAALESVKIGTLIGSKPENVAHWGVGIVRRLSRDAQNNLHVGVEMLTNQVIGVALGGRDSMGFGEDNVALYLNKPNDDSGEAWLLMKLGAFAANRSFNMQLDGKTYLLLPLGLVESGEDYDLARYRKMEQDSGGEE